VRHEMISPDTIFHPSVLKLFLIKKNKNLEVADVNRNGIS
jgi:hypothetical protein